MSAIDDALRNARAYAETFDRADLPRAPVKRLAVVACMDARLHVADLLGLEKGDAHVIRNAGGVVTDHEIRCLAISQRKLGTQEIMLVHHTDCGVLGFPDEGFRRQLRDETGVEPTWGEIGFADLEADVREGVARIRASPFLPHRDHVRGFVYEVETGRLREVS